MLNSVSSEGLNIEAVHGWNASMLFSSAVKLQLLSHATAPHVPGTPRIPPHALAVCLQVLKGAALALFALRRALRQRQPGEFDKFSIAFLDLTRLDWER